VALSRGSRGVRRRATGRCGVHLRAYGVLRLSTRRARPRVLVPPGRHLPPQQRQPRPWGDRYAFNPQHL